MKIYQYADDDQDRVRFDRTVDGQLMVTTESSANRRTQVILPVAEAELLYRELGKAFGSDTPTVKPLTEERVRQIARAEARAVLADFDVSAVARSAGIQAARDQLKRIQS